MLQADKRQQKHIEKMLRDDSDLMYVLDNGIRVDSYISFDSMAEIVDYLRTADKKDDLFEECWKEYRRKGSKGKSKQYWYKLTDDEKELVLPHIKAYVSSRELRFQKDFERYLRDKTFKTIVFNNNNVSYDPTMFEDGKYLPQGFNIWYDEDYKMYCSMDNFYDEKIYDGYTDDNRPDGAMIKLNNARGIVTWNKNERRWIRL